MYFYFQSLFESLNRFLTGDFPVSLKQLVLQFLLVLTSVSTCASFYIIGIRFIYSAALHPIFHYARKSQTKVGIPCRYDLPC